SGRPSKPSLMLALPRLRCLDADPDRGRSRAWTVPRAESGGHARLLRPRYNGVAASARPCADEQPPFRQCRGGAIDVSRPHQHETQASHRALAPLAASLQLAEEWVQIVVDARGKQPQLGDSYRPAAVLPAHPIPLLRQHRNRETGLELLRYEVTERHRARRHSREQNLAVVVEQPPVGREPPTRGFGQLVTGDGRGGPAAPRGHGVRRMEAAHDTRGAAKHFGDEPHPRYG